MEKTLILNPEQIDQKLERMVHQLHEVCFNEKEIIICGIDGNGSIIANYIAQKLIEISEIKPVLANIKIDKRNPVRQDCTLSITDEEYKDKTVLVIDDVSNSGKTLMYGIKHFLNQPIKTLKTLVLVDRSHNRYPVRVDFSGLTISTTLKEHIEVSLDSKDKGVYLM
jgi:pyrimidine operon attenuation protein/uracil phosphoribosyltransferase